MTRYLIIGNSAGGMAAAEAIRSLDAQGSITIVSEETYPAYSRPRLTQFLSGECSEEALFLRPASFWEKKHIQVRLNTRARSLELSSHEVVLGDGERLGWDKLLLAAGAQPLLGREWEGIPGVYAVNSLEDARRILQGLGEKAVVVGAGLIGVSAAKALAHRGVEVALVARSLRVLSTLLDGEASEMVEKALERGGVRVFTNSQGEEIRQHQGKLNVVLGTGREIPCDVVIVGRGVRPRLELVAGTSLEVGEGIRVNEYMETCIPGVYACGDMAEGYDPVAEAYRPNPNWPNAFMGGRVAGQNMAGNRASYLSLPLNSLNLFGLPIMLAGSIAPAPDWEVLRRANGNYRKLLLHRGKIKGVVLVGELRGAGILFNLMRQGVEVDGFEDSLLAEDFGLASLPREFRYQQLALAWGRR